MRTRIFIHTLWVLILTSLNVSAQFDDLYFNPTKDRVTTVKAKKVSQSNYTYNDYTEADNGEVARTNSDYDYDYDEYDHYDEFAYSSRIQRFHRPSSRRMQMNSFDDWWYDDMYYDPFMNPASVNIVLMHGWNSWRWNRPMGMGWNSWGNPYAFNSWNAGWGWNRPMGMGWNSWGNPYGFNNWNSGWGWNSWNSCPSQGFGNNVFYNNNVWVNNNNFNNNNNNNNSGNNRNSVYGSRRDGSLTTSTRGRDNSPKRTAGNDTKDTPQTLDANGSVVNSRSSSNTNRSYRGDINTSDETRRTSRSRIYEDTDQNGNTNRASRSREDSNMSNSRNNESRRSTSPSSAPTRTDRSIERSQPSSRNLDTPPSRSNNSGSSRSYDTPSRSSSSGSSSRSNSGFNSGSSSRSSSGSMNSGSSSRSSSGSMNSGSSSRSSSGGSTGSRRGG